MYKYFLWTLFVFLFLGCKRTPNYPYEISLAASPGTSIPMEFELPPNIPDSEYFRGLGPKGEEIALQKTGERKWALILPPSMTQKEQIQLRLIPEFGYTSQGAQNVELIIKDGLIKIFAKGKEVLSYVVDMQYPPDSLPDYYKRNGFLHPVKSPSGKTITDGFPEGHTHQHGIFLAFVNTTYKGEKVDFWNQQAETGTVVHQTIIDTVSGPVFAEFKTNLTHMAFIEDSSYEVLDETWTVRVYNTTDDFIIDLRSDIQLLGEEPLKINEYHYGGFGIRGSGTWFDPDHQANENPTNYLGEGQGGFLTSEGKTRIEANHSRPHWVSIHGNIEGQMAGITAMGSPLNFRAPQPVRIHPSMPYFCFAPMVLGEYEILPGETYTSSYRLVIEDGKPVPEELDAQFEVYSSQQVK